MYLNFQALEAAPELISIEQMTKILNRTDTAARVFIKRHNIRIKPQGTRKNVVKSDLLNVLNENNWLPTGWL